MKPVDLSALDNLFRNMAGRVRYKLGAKAGSLQTGSNTIRQIDCSGFVRYALARATCGEVVLPDGSWYQHQWCEQHLRQLESYADVRHAAKDPGRLFVAFIEPGALGKDKSGHVWLVRAGRSLESCYGKGVSSRKWNSPTLLKASACYELPAVA